MAPTPFAARLLPARPALPALFALGALLGLGACDCDDCDDPPPPVATIRPVSILVEVYDPATNFVWENVGVRVVEAQQEWQNCTCVSPFTDVYLTDADGRVLFDEGLLAALQVGFMEDANGLAVLGSRSFEDEATVLLEVSAEGFTPVFAQVQLSFANPDVFIAVPFQ